jgi:hypothetical protein
VTVTTAGRRVGSIGAIERPGDYFGPAKGLIIAALVLAVGLYAAFHK